MACTREANRAGASAVFMAVLFGLLTAACEMEDPTASLQGGSVIGTWSLLESAVKAKGAPYWTSIKYGEQRAAAQGLFGRIAFYGDNTCYGELISDGRAQNFEGSWTSAGPDLVVDCGGEAGVVAGRYGVENDQLVFTTTRAEGDVDVDVTFVMQRAPALEPPVRPGIDDTAGGDDDGDDDDDRATGSSSRSGSQTFLWKPESENDGNAVTLFPARYQLDDIDEVHIKGGDRDGDEPRTIYWPNGHNGNRVHARWSAEGDEFGEDFEVVLVLESGKEVSWHVDDGGDRQED